MMRMLFIGAVLLMAACSSGTMCGDLCSDNMPCTGGKYQCVGSRCLIITDAGPASCK